MKRKKNFLKPGNVIIDTSPEIKMSELIGEYAFDYINMGKSTKEHQTYLNGAMQCMEYCRHTRRVPGSSDPPRGRGVQEIQSRGCRCGYF